MKIVHIIAKFNPELGYHLYSLARKQVELGHDVSIITTNSSMNIPGAAKILDAAESSRFFSIRGGIKIFRLKCYFNFKGIVLAAGLKKILTEIKPDVVHAYEPRHVFSVLPALYKNKLNYKYVMEVHDYYLPQNSLLKYEYLLFRKRLCNLAFRKADKIIAITPATKKFLSSVHRVEESKIYFMPLWVDIDILNCDKLGREKIRLKYKIKENETVLVHAGQIVPIKRIDFMLNVFAELAKSYPLKLFIVGGGDGGYLKYLETLSKKLNIADRIFFIERVPQKELAKYFSAADIAVWPHRATITIIEAMACGLSIVIPNKESMSHLASHKNGLTFEDGNAEDFKRKIEYLIKHKKIREKFSKNSKIAVSKLFSHEVAARKITQLYSSL